MELIGFTMILVIGVLLVVTALALMVSTFAWTRNMSNFMLSLLMISVGAAAIWFALYRSPLSAMMRC